MTKPTNLDPVEWAKYNQSMQRTLARMMGFPEPEFDLTPYEIEIRTIPSELAEPARDLMLDVRRAASELEGQGERSDRIALQLITALARFAQETGL